MSVHGGTWAVSRVLVIGLDGGTWEILKPWIDSGELPALRSLIEHGFYGHLKSTIPMFTPTAWSSFMTGMNPGKHGIMGFIIYGRDGAPKVASALDRRGEEIWTILSKYGKRVVVINVPMTYPPKPVNGVLISGFPAPSKGFAYPPEVERWLKREGYRVEAKVEYEEGREESFIRAIRDLTKKRAEVGLKLMARYDWDFFAIVFSGTDRLQHALWRFLDDEHPRHDAARAAEYRQVIFDYYNELDRIIGKFVSEAGSDAYTIIMSDHGFGPLHKFIHVNEWLIRLGFLKLKKNLITRFKRILYLLGVTPENMYYFMARLHLASLRRKLGRERGRKLLERLSLSYKDVDWKRTLAFSLGAMGQIYINRTRVKQREDYLSIREQIVNALRKLTDPETGECVVEEVFVKEQVYRGPLLDRMPDIVFIPKPGYVAFEEYEFASNKVQSVSRTISGTHRPYGIIIVSHHSIKGPIEINPPAEIIDIAPTVLRILGVPIPNIMDGKPIISGG